MGWGRKGRKVQGEEYLTFIIYEVKNLLFHKKYKKKTTLHQKMFLLSRKWLFEFDVYGIAQNKAQNRISI